MQTTPEPASMTPSSPSTMSMLVASDPSARKASLSFVGFLVRAVLVVVVATIALMGAFYGLTKMGVLGKSDIAASVTFPASDPNTKHAAVSFTFTEQWHAILTPQGEAYSRCDPYVAQQRWVMLGNQLTIERDLSCKPTA